MPLTLQSARQRLNIVVDLVPRESSNRPGTPLHPSKITIHNTDNDAPGADARAHAQYQKGEDARQRQVSWHFTVDDGAVYQSLPVSEVGWHAGTHEGNSTSIGIEICENKGIDQEAANDRAALLTAVQLHELNIALGNVVQHNAWSGKNCPALLRQPPTNWTAFLQKVEDYYNQIDLTADDHTHPMITLPLAPIVPPPPAAAPEFTSSGISLSWNSDSHPERQLWTDKLIGLVHQYKAQLDQGNPNAFVPGYNTLKGDEQVKFWGELFVAMSKFESSWNPKDVYREADGQNSVGLLQLSIGDQKHYALKPQLSSEEGLKDPLANLQWGVAIFANWTDRDKVIATGVIDDNRGGARYWSVLRGGPTHHYLEIQTLTKKYSGII